MRGVVLLALALPILIDCAEPSRPQPAEPASPAATPGSTRSVPIDAGTADATSVADAASVADATIAPTVSPATPACRPEPRFDHPAKPGSKHSAGLRGMSAAEVIAKRGAPNWCRSPTLWRYAYPDGCAYERTVVSLWLVDAKVSRTTEVRFVTGQHCE